MARITESITEKLFNVLKNTSVDVSVYFEDGDSIDVNIGCFMTEKEVKEKLFEEIKKTGKLKDEEIKKYLGLTDTDNL